MRVSDLGELAGEVLIFGGPYSNLQALEALRAEADARRSDHVLCTGDVVAYAADAAGCVALMRDWGVPVVAGNCETQLGADAADCGCGFEEGSTCSIASVRWFAHATAQVSGADRAWMAALPDVITFRHAGMRVAALHGGATANNRFLWPNDPAALGEELAALEAAVGPVDRVLAGHCGLAYRVTVGGVDWINAGVIGMPPNDGAPETRFATIDANGVPRLHRLRYDHAAAAATMRAVGLTQGYDTGLETGWWPAEDVLPMPLRRASVTRERMMREYELF